MIKTHRGFTLIELLAVILLLGIGLVGVAGMFTAGIVSSRKAANETAAANRATQEIERVRDGGFLGAIIDTAHFPSPRYVVVSSSKATFTVPELSHGAGEVTIGTDTAAQPVDPNTGFMIGNLKRVMVKITWGGGANVRGSYSISTLISNRAH
jgi:prepilin-type N-terminal cleavage/methylation domain-containing protein